MRERPILFSGQLVRAILEGRKTQTRRVVKFTNKLADAWAKKGSSPATPDWYLALCPYGAEGDRLWVRETWAPCDGAGEQPGDSHTLYRADGDDGTITWRPSRYMPRSRSRIDLEVTEVRIERLQAITDEDAKAEGLEVYVDEGATYYGPLDRGHACPRQAFAGLWDTINGKRDGCSWADNPFVWVVSFRMVR